MVRVRLAPLDSKMYLGRGHRAAVEEPWSHLPVLHQTLPRSGPPVPPPQPFQKLDLTCCGTEEAIRVSPVGGKLKDAKIQIYQLGTRVGTDRGAAHAKTWFVWHVWNKGHTDEVMTYGRHRTPTENVEPRSHSTLL